MEAILEKNINTSQEEPGKKPEKIGEGLEAEKKQKMDNLERKLKELDKNGNNLRWENSKNRIMLQYDEKVKDEKKFFCVYNNKEYRLTLGDIMADYNWGLKYAPDRDMPNNVYRQISKRILVNETRRDIERIYDKELIEKLHLPDYEDNRLRQGGRIAEEIVREFMTRLSYIPDLRIKIMRSTEFEDIREKIDFKVYAAPHRRGVKTVDENDLNKNINKLQRLGFQLFIKGKKERDNTRLLVKKTADVKLSKKIYKNILDVDDIILVGLYLYKMKNNYEQWLRDGRPPGGPEQYLIYDQKKMIFRGITEGLKIDISDGELKEILKT